MRSGLQHFYCRRPADNTPHPPPISGLLRILLTIRWVYVVVSVLFDVELCGVPPEPRLGPGLGLLDVGKVFADRNTKVARVFTP